ncbi:hypothetical protein J6TS1_07000 [Siminovitchia terrae]|uniref:Uncharacterized protein n=1 Tax=Siminovitchia terrae TaxID=1914933 RepID=A0A429XB59_SIMTE|nr:hypothetical protein [Siminovitchia terrae]RST60664.1 hypothetical protein D5F11_004745 [Siminovitchia terrae]GIN94830.1 hypothetical protein J6TS1_07000 [Siminovitchia terrae]
MMRLLEKKIHKIYFSLNVVNPYQIDHLSIIDQIADLLGFSIHYYDEPSEANNCVGSSASRLEKKGTKLPSSAV